MMMVKKDAARASVALAGRSLQMWANWKMRYGALGTTLGMATALLVLGGASLLHAQAVSAGNRNLVLSVGGEFSNYRADLGPDRLSGIGLFADLDSTHFWGAELETRWIGFGNAHDQRISNYLVGGRFRYPIHDQRIEPYVKALFGAGNMRFRDGAGTGSYFAMVPGAGVDFKTSTHLRVRVEYELEVWPSAPGVPEVKKNGMTPNGFNLGLAWKIP